MPVFWQFAMERKCGNLGTAKSKRKPNESLSNLMVHQEQLKLIPFCIPPIVNTRGPHGHLAGIGSGYGGVAGTGLNTMNKRGDRLVTVTGRLAMVRLFAFFKSVHDDRYGITGSSRHPLNPTRDPANTSDRILRRDRHDYSHHPLMGTGLPPNYDTRPLFQLPSDFMERARHQDFDLVDYLQDWRPRPVDYVEFQRNRDRHLTKKIAFFQPMENYIQPGALSQTMLTGAQKLAFFRYLELLNYFPLQLNRVMEEERFQRLQQLGLSFKKWKVMEIYNPYGMVGVDKSRVLARDGLPRLYGIDQQQRRNATRVQFSLHSAAAPVRSSTSKFGTVLFFATINHPEDLPGMTLDNIEAPEEKRQLLLACIETFPVEETSDGVALRVKHDHTRKNAVGDLVFIEATKIHCLIGLETSENREYVMWKDGCWTSAWERSVVRRSVMFAREQRRLLAEELRGGNEQLEPHVV